MAVEKHRFPKQREDKHRQADYINDGDIKAAENADVKRDKGASDGGKDCMQATEDGSRKDGIDHLDGNTRIPGTNLLETSLRTAERCVDDCGMRERLKGEGCIDNETFGTSETEIGMHKSHAHDGRIGGDAV